MATQHPSTAPSGVQRILDFIATQPTDGVGPQSLHDIAPDLSRRTLQRILSNLVAQGRLVRLGKGPAKRYMLPGVNTEVSDDYSTYIPLSDASRELIRQLRKPTNARKLANYEPSWLDAYLPNQTFYLDRNTRGLLRRLGHTGLQESPTGTYGRQILDRLLIDLSWASSHLEGNSYSALDTERLIIHGEAANGKDAAVTQMILNHKRAIEMVVEHAETIGFNRFTFLNLHGLLSENLLHDPNTSGRLQTRRSADFGQHLHTYRDTSDP